MNVTRTNKKTLEKEKDHLTNSHIDARRIKDKKQVTDYDYKKTEDQCSKIKEELNRAQYENRDLESRIDIFKRQEEEIDQQLALVHTTLNNQHHKHQRQAVERDDLRNKVCLHDAEGKDKRTEYDRTLDMCTELNHIIDSETHNRDVLYESVRALEQDRVVLLKNNDRYTEEEIELHKTIQNNYKTAEVLKQQHRKLGDELDRMIRNDLVAAERLQIGEKVDHVKNTNTRLLMSSLEKVTQRSGYKPPAAALRNEGGQTDGSRGAGLLRVRQYRPEPEKSTSPLRDQTIPTNIMSQRSNTL